MKTSKADYFGGMNESSKNRKTLATSSVFGVISSILTGGKSANITATADTEYREVDIGMPYGIASFGSKGMKAHILSTGRKDMVVGLVDPKRPATKKGEVIIYSEDGTQIKLDNKGNIDIKSDKNVTVTAQNVVVNAQNVTVSGNINITGNLSVSGSISSNGSISTNGSISSNGFTAPGGVWHNPS